MPGTGGGYYDFKRSYQLSPIILVGGLAKYVGGSIPIWSLTDPGNYVLGLISQSSSEQALDDNFAHFEPVAGSTLMTNEIAHYPFANAAVAANAVIVQPLRISMLMRTPARGQGGFAQKSATMSALKASLDKHISLGGLFNVVTPAYVYTSLLLTELRLLQAERPDQPQSLWQWDFEKPLVTQADAQQVYSVSMNRMAAAIPQSGDPPATSGPQVNVATTGSVAGVGAVPAQSGIVGGAAPGPSRGAPPLPTTNP